MNSVSSVLSANPHIFESGFGRLKQPGWWALKVIIPPQPSQTIHNSNNPVTHLSTSHTSPPPSSYTIPPSTSILTDPSKVRQGGLNGEEAIEDEMVDVGKDQQQGNLQNIPKRQNHPFSSNGSMPIQQQSHSHLFNQPQRPPLGRPIYGKSDFSIPQVASLLPPMNAATATPTTMRAAEEIKRKLIERLLRVDSKLLKEALSSTHSLGAISQGSFPLSRLSDTSANPLQMASSIPSILSNVIASTSAITSVTTSTAASTMPSLTSHPSSSSSSFPSPVPSSSSTPIPHFTSSMDAYHPQGKGHLQDANMIPSASTPASTTGSISISISTSSTSNLSSSCQSSTISSPALPSLKDRTKLHRILKPVNYVRASPHENELLETCLRVADPDPSLNRLKRKLIVRRMRRRCGLSVFDVDTFMYKYLKSTEYIGPSDASDIDGVSQAKGPSNEADAMPGESATMATFDSTREKPSLAPPQKILVDVPFHRDPSLSFLAKIVGVSNVLHPYPPEMISPFTGVRLPRFLHRERMAKPRKLQLLRELKAKRAPYDPDPKESVPIQGMAQCQEDAIDFVFMRKEWLPQVNRLLARFFWPGIDMWESLDYPDYGVLVMYRKLVIGCAFITPEGYITYLLIHPDWDNAGLGKILLYILLTRVAPPHRDVTLHVSVTNPALLLYQQFGFKPEEYIINFYDKYFRKDDHPSLSDHETDMHHPGGGYLQRHSPNAFFIRFRR